MNIADAMRAPGNARFAAIAAFVLASAVAVYLAYAANEKRKVVNTIVSLVADTGARLDAALRADPAAAAPDHASVQAELDAHVVAADGLLVQLRGLEAAPVRLMADAADEYLSTCAEILRRMAAMARERAQLALSMQALAEHMRADSRRGGWVTQAIRAKDRMDADYRHYRHTAEALARLLDGYSLSRRGIAAHVDPRLLPDEAAVESARSRTLAQARTASEQVETAGRLEAYR